ncbi:unnamed protein product [Prunus brigantina]
MIWEHYREMMEPEARRGERATYRKPLSAPYPAHIDQIPHPPALRIQLEATISDIAALKQSEDEPAQDFCHDPIQK